MPSGIYKRTKPIWNKGRKDLPKASSSTKLKMSLQRKNEKHPGWVGDKVGYMGIHSWISNNWGKAKDFKCAFCECDNSIRKLNWANMDHKYTRDRKDWNILCVKCHHNYDAVVLGVKYGRTKYE